MLSFRDRRRLKAVHQAEAAARKLDQRPDALPTQLGALKKGAEDAEVRQTSSRLSAAINSPAAIWLASAMFLTIGGGVLTRSDACYREAREIEERYQAVAREVDRRTTKIAQAILVSTTPELVRSALALRDGEAGASGLRAVPLDELHATATEILLRYNVDDQGRPLQSFLIADRMDPRTNLIEVNATTVRSESIPYLKELSRTLLIWARAETLIRYTNPAVRLCDPASVLDRAMFDPTGAIVRINRKGAEVLRQLATQGLIVHQLPAEWEHPQMLEAQPQSR